MFLGQELRETCQTERGKLRGESNTNGFHALPAPEIYTSENSDLFSRLPENLATLVDSRRK